jgi:hypothetical protein
MKEQKIDENLQQLFSDIKTILVEKYSMSFEDADNALLESSIYDSDDQVDVLYKFSELVEDYRFLRKYKS